MTEERRLIVMSRWPVPGETKTRLVPRLGAEGAARLSAAMMSDILTRFSDVAARRLLAVCGAREHAVPLSFPEEAWTLIPQPEGDLGARLLALARAGEGALIFLGSDCPTMPRGVVDEAFAVLEGGADAVFQPALDGGYTLAGFRGDPAPLLRDIPWGGDGVLRATLERAREAEKAVELLDPWYDIDEPGDLEHLARHRARLLSADRHPKATLRALADSAESKTC